MKKNIFILAGFLSISLIGCASHKGVEKGVEVEDGSTVDVIENVALGKEFSPLSMNGLLKNHSFLNETHIGSKIEITGLLVKNESSYVLIEDADSKGRVSFELEFDSSNNELISRLNELSQSNVTIEGVLVATPSPWTKKLLIENIKN